ncbi:MAG: DUF2062 domain-containing protein [Pseudomonadota bacterium]
MVVFCDALGRACAIPLYRRLRYNLQRLRGLQGSPPSLARGCALGVFMGIAPVIPLRSALILLLAAPARANLLAAFVLGHTVGNPLAIPIWYSAALACGNLLVETGVTWERVRGMLDRIQGAESISSAIAAFTEVGVDAVIVLIAGGCVIALPAAGMAYILGLRYFAGRAERLSGADEAG